MSDDQFYVLILVILCVGSICAPTVSGSGALLIWAIVWMALRWLEKRHAGRV